MKFFSVVTPLFVMSLAAPASSTVLGGSLTGGSAQSGGGIFAELTPAAGFTVGNNQQQSNNLFAFDEQQDVLLLSDLATDLGGTLSSGTRVSSHYVFFDPRSLQSALGYVDFGAPILGVMSSRGSELATDSIFGLSTVTYLSPLLRGIEIGDSVSVTGSRMYVDWHASTPGDYVRVLTGVSVAVVPEPGAWTMLIAGFGLLGSRIRARRSPHIRHV